jgi:hypothetical protein
MSAKRTRTFCMVESDTGCSHFLRACAGSATCNSVPSGYRFYPGFFFNNGTSGSCNSISNPLSSDTLLRLGASCAQDPNCKAFTTLPSDGQVCSAAQRFLNRSLRPTPRCARLLPRRRHCAPRTRPSCSARAQWTARTHARASSSRVSATRGPVHSPRRRCESPQLPAGRASTHVPFLSLCCAETCGEPVPQGFVFYPTYDMNSTNGGCFQYTTQAGYNLQSAFSHASSVIMSECRNNGGCVGVSFLPGTGDVSVRRVQPVCTGAVSEQQR